MMMVSHREHGRPAWVSGSGGGRGVSRTTTRDPVRRLLCVGIALILRNVWVWLHRTVLARPRRGSREIRLDLLRFRRMLLWLAHVVEEELGVRDSITIQLC